MRWFPGVAGLALFTSVVFINALFMNSGAVAAGCSPDQVTLKGDWGQVQFSAEIADTPRERSRGLMHRKTLPRGDGMLFVYDQPQRASFWMKNTLIPLDMIFTNRGGRVTHVHHNAIPRDLTQIEGGKQVFAVLEINAGLARQYGIDVGSLMRHPVFSDGPAIWPC